MTNYISKQEKACFMSGNYEEYHLGGGKLKESLLDLTFTWKICWSPGEPAYCFPTYGRKISIGGK